MIENWTELYCFGSYSCHRATVQAGYWILFSEDYNPFLRCDGYNSCSHSTIMTKDSIKIEISCIGDESCAYANITSASKISAWASRSLYGAIIDTDPAVDDIMEMYMYGDFAGYGARLICRAGVRCKIYCKGNGCLNFFVECIGTCRFFHDQPHPIEITANQPFPTNFTLDALNPNDTDDQKCAMVNFDDSSFFGCSLYGCNLNGTQQSAEKGPICCRADQACAGAYGSLTLNDAQSSDILCSGGGSCIKWPRGPITNNGGSVTCSGRQSCLYSSIIADVITCSARGSCSESVLNTSKSVECSDCSYSKIYSTSTELTVNFGGYLSGRNTVIHCNEGSVCNVSCRGYQSCFDTEIICDGICNVECSSSACSSDWPNIVTSNPTRAPTGESTMSPTIYPSELPTFDPTQVEAKGNTMSPTTNPTSYPSESPTLEPINLPTQFQMEENTNNPTMEPTSYPLVSPTLGPTLALSRTNDGSGMATNDIIVIIIPLIGFTLLVFGFALFIGWYCGRKKLKTDYETKEYLEEGVEMNPVEPREGDANVNEGDKIAHVKHIRDEDGSDSFDDAYNHKRKEKEKTDGDESTGDLYEIDKGHKTTTAGGTVLGGSNV